MGHTIVKVISSFIIFVSGFAGCNEFYDMALNGPGIIYSVTDNAMTYKELLVTGGDSVYRYSSGISVPITNLAVDGDSRAVMYSADFINGITHPSHGLSGTWQIISADYPANCRSMAGNRDGIYILAGSAGAFSIYRFDEGSLDNYINYFGSSTDVTADLTGETNLIMFTSSDDGEIYCYENNGIDPCTSWLYRFDRGKLSVLNTGANSLITPFFGDKVGNYLYVGSSASLYRFHVSESMTPLVYSGPATIFDYAIIDSNTIFSVQDNGGTWGIYRLSAGSFVSEHTFSGSPTGVLIEPFRGNLAVGVKGGTVDDGLYLYDISARTLEKIDASPVLALQVR